MAVLLAVVVALVLLGRQVAGQDTSAVPPGPEESATVAGAETEQQRLEVVAAAEAVLRTWSRPDLGYREWWRALRGLMTSGGRQAYAYTDPAQVPRLGEIEATDVRMSPSGTTATVFFSSDAGRFGVDLSRDDVGSGWLANRIVFPGSESMF